MRVFLTTYLKIWMILFSISTLAQGKEYSYKAAFLSRSYIKQGNTDYNKGVLESAIVNYRKSIDNTPTNYKAHINLGNAYLENGQYDEAHKSYAAAIKNAANVTQKHKALYNKGVVAQTQENWKEAVQIYKQAMFLNPNDPQLRYNLANAIQMLDEEEQQQDGEGQENDHKEKSDNKKQNQSPEKKEEEKEQENTEEEQEEDEALDDDTLEQLLNSLKEEDEATQQKMNQKNFGSSTKKQDKNW